MEQMSLFELETAYTLDSCPKCGKVPDMLTEIDTRGTIDTLGSWKGGLGIRTEPTEKQLYSVDCKTCYIPDPGANAFTYNVFFTPEEAAEHWSQRVKIAKEKTT